MQCATFLADYYCTQFLKLNGTVGIRPRNRINFLLPQVFLIEIKKKNIKG